MTHTWAIYSLYWTICILLEKLYTYVYWKIGRYKQKILFVGVLVLFYPNNHYTYVALNHQIQEKFAHIAGKNTLCFNNRNKIFYVKIYEDVMLNNTEMF